MNSHTGTRTRATCLLATALSLLAARIPKRWSPDELDSLLEHGPPEIRRPSFFRLGGSVGFRNSAQGWSLRLLGENLTDEATSFVVAETPAVPGLRTKFPEPPRLLFGEFRWEF